MRKLLLTVLICYVSALSAQNKITVAADGSGNFKTVQSALDAVPLNNKKPITIYVKNGVHKEKLHLDSSNNFLTLTRRI